MFSRIAMLVLQERVRPRKYGRKWRRKAKQATDGTGKGEKKLKYVKPKTKQKSALSKNVKTEKSKLNKTDTPKPNETTEKTKSDNTDQIKPNKTEEKDKTKSDITDPVKHKKTANNSVRKTGKYRKCLKTKAMARKRRPRRYFRSKERYSNEIFEGVMAEIKKYAKGEDKPQPEPIPNAISLDLQGSHASHEDVYYRLKDIIKANGGCEIVSIQYLPLSFRWLILLDSKKSRDIVAGKEVEINGKTVVLRRYDDIKMLEYKKYLRANGFMDTLKNSSF